MQVNLWKDPKEQILDPTLFSTKAEELAKEIGSKGKNLNKNSQIRKFYDDVIRLNEEAKRNIRKWEDILPQVHMIIAKAAYAKGRNLVSDSFLNLIKGCISQVKRPEDLNVFANFFEAFMGYYKVYGPK